MKTYYIEIERQGYTLAVIKVNADTYEEAELKAFKALHANDYVNEISEDEALERLDLGDIDYMIDENGDEVDIDELEEENNTEEKFIVYMVDESGVEASYEYENQEEAIGDAIKFWDEGDGGYSKVSVHEVTKEQTVKDISKQNQIWYADHNM